MSKNAAEPKYKEDALEVKGLVGIAELFASLSARNDYDQRYFPPSETQPGLDYSAGPDRLELEFRVPFTGNRVAIDAGLLTATIEYAKTHHPEWTRVLKVAEAHIAQSQPDIDRFRQKGLQQLKAA